MTAAAGENALRLDEILELADGSKSRGGKEIAAMVDKILSWGWKPATGQLESKALLSNTVSTDSLILCVALKLMLRILLMQECVKEVTEYSTALEKRCTPEQKATFKTNSASVATRSVAL
jgi:hypothetical protein